jgi:chitin disaccharide deacetylase
MAARRLIVHGDDFGLSEGVNEGIVQSHLDGVLTSASLIASGAAFEHAIRLLRDTPTLDIGVHLTLVGEKPVSSAVVVPSLIGSNGHFHRHAGAFMKRYLIGAISLQEVRRELSAQIAKVVACGVKVTHLDSHQHLHMVPGIRRVVGELAREQSIPSVRYPREAPRLYMLQHQRRIIRLSQLLVLNTFCAFAPASDAKRPDHFFGFYYGGALDKGNLLKILKALPSSGTCELMCHPGLNDPESRYAEWGYRWEDERDALTDKAIKDYIARKGIQLISYADLQAT